MTGTHGKTPLRGFLAANPFPDPLTIGFFYREKMRAIHRTAPDEQLDVILEVGGGRSGLTALLYPGARVVNLDMDAAFGAAPCNRQPRVSFLCGDAVRLPFPDGHFDAVTMFDLIEHVPDDRAAIAEAFRVLRPGGWLMLSTPNERWRYPYYRIMRPICPDEAELFAEWGHVRRGYRIGELEALAGSAPHARASFISPLTALQHDVSFARLSHGTRRLLCALLSPVTWLGYVLHSADTPGTETAVSWRVPTDR